MLNRKKQKPKRRQDRFDTLVSARTAVEGTIHFSGGLHVDGKVYGNVIAEEQAESALIRLSECGEVHGDIVAPNIIINGTVVGDVFALSHLELAEKAAITGNVYYNLVEMAAGASVNGSMVQSKDPDALPRPVARRLGTPEAAENEAKVPQDDPDGADNESVGGEASPITGSNSK